MKKRVLLVLLLSLLCGCTLPAAQTDEHKAAAQLDAAESALRDGDYAAALEAYRALEALTPADLSALRGEIAALTGLQNTQYAAPDELIAAYEALYAADAFTETDYAALSELYIAAGLTRQARDLLERGECLAPTAEKAARLETICVDVAGESEAVRAALAPVLEALAQNDVDGAAQALAAPGLYETLCSRVAGASRRYTALEEGGAAVKLLVTSNGAGQAQLSLWRITPEGGVIAVRRTQTQLLLSQAHATDGAWDGAFTVRCFQAANGSYTQDSGSFQNGVAAGEVTTRLSAGNALTLSELWESRETLPLSVYTGELDAQGHATAPQDEDLADGVIYAYGDNDQDYVYLLPGEGETAESYVFTPASFGLEPLPRW